MYRGHLHSLACGLFSCLRSQQRLTDPFHILSLWHSFLPLKGPPGLHGATRQPRITSFSWGELTSSLNPPLAQSHSTSAGSQGEDADIFRGAVIILPTHGLYRTKRTLRVVSLRRDCGQAGTSDLPLHTRHGVIIKTLTVHVGFHHLDLMPIDVSAIRKQETEKHSYGDIWMHTEIRSPFNNLQGILL